MEHSAAARESGIGACQQIDSDTLFESIIGPQPLDDHDPRLQTPEGARMHHDAAPLVPDAHTLAVAQTERMQHFGMDEGVGRPSRATLDGVLLKLVLRNEREGAAT